MQQLQKYNFEFDKPLSQPYSKDGIFNAFYKGYQSQKHIQVLVSQYREPKFERLITKQKRLQKLKVIKHKNVAEIYDIILDKENKRLFVVLEWCSGGNLYDYEKSNSSIDCDLAVKILYELAIGLREIHKGNQMHRFINMENVEFDGKGNPKLTFKCLYPKTYYLSPQDKQGNRSKQSDLFSLGVLFYKLLLGQTPFKGNSLEQQLKNVQEGPKFPKNDKEIFPLSLPIQIKNLIIGMTMYKPQQRLTDDFVIEHCQKYLQKASSSYDSIPNEFTDDLAKKIFRQEFIPLYTRKASQEEYILIALDPSKHEFTKFHIYKSKSKISLTNYVQDVLQPFREIKNQVDIVPIYENFLVDDEYLVIRTFYDNQGSLKYYLEHSGSIQPEYNKHFTDKLLEKLEKYGKAHNFLTSENILIKGGDFYLNYPPFLTKQLVNSLKNEKKQISMIAPEIKDGKSSKNGDSWSVAMLKYFLQNSQLPKFDKNGKVIVPNRNSKNKQQVNFYEDCLIQDQEKRKSLFKQQTVKQEQPSVPQISQINIVTSRQKSKPVTLPKPNIPRDQKKAFGQILSQKLYMFQDLEGHWTKPIRVGIKCFIGVMMLLFLFYYNFFIINGQLITQHSLYEPCPVYIRAFPSDSTPYINYTLVTKDPSKAQTTFYNQTVSVLRDSYVCVLNDYSVGSNVVQVINQHSFTAYQIFGILLAIFNLIIFCVSLSKMDFPKVYQICKLDENNFNEIWNWMFINLALASQISCVYLLYGSLFHMSLEPCLSKATLTAVEFLFKKWYFSFNIRFIWIYLGLIFSYMVITFFIIKPTYIVHRYVKAGLIALYLTGVFCRIMGGSGGYIAWQKESVFGKLGQLLLLIISIIFGVLDLIFGCLIERQQMREVKGNNQVTENSITEMNQTEQNFLPN